MLDKLNKIKENKILKTIWNIIYTILFLIVILMLMVVVLQRFSNNEKSILGYRMYTVVSGSMMPAYEVGDIVVSKEIDAKDLNVGDHIVYLGKKGSLSNMIITHRIEEIEKKSDGTYRIVTQGIANSMQDPEINESQIYGKVIYKMKFLSFINKKMKNIYVFYTLIVLSYLALFIKKR